MQNVDMSRLSPRSQATRILIGDQMPSGYNVNEIASALGRPTSWVSDCLTSLRNELLLQSGFFFPLAESEYDSLRGSIERHGIRQPVLVGQHITLVDGHHRLLIAEELGLTDAPCVFLDGLSLEQERELSIGLNAARRQLSGKQKRTLVEAELMRDPARSDRLIASICGTAHPLVGEVRAEISRQLEADDEVELTSTGHPDGEARERAVDREPPRARLDMNPPVRIDRAGQEQRVRTQTAVLERRREALCYLACSHGQMHTLYRDGSDYLLVAEEDK